MKPEWSAEIELAPAFHDLDPMAVVWHGNYFKYFELARTALLEKIQYDYPQMKDSGYAWPIVDLCCKYVGFIHYQQAIIVQASIIEWENRLKIEYRIKDKASGKTLTRAHSIQVAVDIQTREMCFASPKILFEKLGLAND